MQRRLPLALSIAALLVAVLGSTPLGRAVAEATIAANVGSGQLQAGAVTVTKIRNGHVTNEKLATGAVTTRNVRDGSLTSADLAGGVVPPHGISEVVVRRAEQTLNATGFRTQSVACEEGWKVLGGGGGYLAETGDAYVTQPFYGSLIASGPLAGETAAADAGAGSGWSVTVLSSSPTAKRLAAFVLCGR